MLLEVTTSPMKWAEQPTQRVVNYAEDIRPWITRPRSCMKRIEIMRDRRVRQTGGASGW